MNNTPDENVTVFAPILPKLSVKFVDDRELIALYHKMVNNGWFPEWQDDPRVIEAGGLKNAVLGEVEIFLKGVDGKSAIELVHTGDYSVESSNGAHWISVFSTVMVGDFRRAPKELMQPYYVKE